MNKKLSNKKSNNQVRKSIPSFLLKLYETVFQMNATIFATISHFFVKK